MERVHLSRTLCARKDLSKWIAVHNRLTVLPNVVRYLLKRKAKRYLGRSSARKTNHHVLLAPPPSELPPPQSLPDDESEEELDELE
jgi:hypothetical protein